MGILSDLNPVSAIVNSVGGAVRSVGGMIFGDREARDRHSHDEIMSVQAGYQAEFLAPEKRSWFGQFVDGMNRLVRPFFTYGTVGIFIWCVVDPAAFSVAMLALKLIPDNLWYIMGAIITFWFGSRTLIDQAVAKKATSGPTEAEVAGVLNAQKSMLELRDAAEQDKFAAKLKRDNPTPVDNPELQDWINKFK